MYFVGWSMKGGESLAKRCQQSEAVSLWNELIWGQDVVNVQVWGWNIERQRYTLVKWTVR